MNPIFAREWRSRWRDKRSFWLLFALCALMALMVGIVYKNAFPDYAYYASLPAYYNEEPPPPSVAGRTLFQAIAYANGLAWLFIAPVLASTPIARERERGLLESLQLSQMRPFGQTLARFISHLAFLLALQTITLPVYGLCIAFGGVSSDEILSEALCILLIAMFGVALGMWISSRAYRPMGALFTTMGIVVFVIVGIPTMATGQYIFEDTDIGVWRFVHPFFLLQALMERAFYTGMRGSFVDDLPYALGANAILLTFFLFDCTRMSRKNFPPPSWRTRNATTSKWKTEIEARRLERERQKQERATREKVASALVADLPLEKFVRFKNPVLSREVKARFRLRKPGFFASLLLAGTFFITIIIWLLTAFSLLDPVGSEEVSGALLIILCVSGPFFIGLVASMSFVREIESGTWEGLRLSLLTNYELLSAKFVSPIIAFCYYTIPLWILVPFMLKVTHPVKLFVSLVVVFSTFALSSAVGLWCSRKNRSPVAAACWTFAVLVGLWVAGPMLLDGMRVDRYLNQLLVPPDSTLYSNQDDYDDYYYDRTRILDYSPPMALESFSALQRQTITDYLASTEVSQTARFAIQKVLVSCAFSIALTLFILWRLWCDLKEMPRKPRFVLPGLSRGSRIPSR